MLLYKLTDQDGCTLNGTQWGENVTHHAADTSGGPLCTASWIHAHENPLIGGFMNPIQGQFDDPILWEAEGQVGIREGQLKCGCRSLTTIRQIPLEQPSVDQAVAFGILSAMAVIDRADKFGWDEEKGWKTWAEKWLSGIDRSANSALYAQNTVISKAKAPRTIFYSAAGAAKNAAAIKDGELWGTAMAILSPRTWAATTASHVQEINGKEIDFYSIAREAMKI